MGGEQPLAAVLGNAMNKLSDNVSPTSKDRAIEAGRYAISSRKINYLYQPNVCEHGLSEGTLAWLMARLRSKFIRSTGFKLE